MMMFQASFHLSRSISLIFLFCSKFHNAVNHEILIGNWRKYGIRDIAGDWIQSYLEDRKQYSAVNGLKSGTRTVTCGIPQGSYLGPLLCKIYLNDCKKCLIDSKVSLYADDIVYRSLIESHMWNADVISFHFEFFIQGKVTEV